jgi:hypothetical protein
MLPQRKTRPSLFSMHVGTQQKNKQKDDIQKYLRSHAENEK